LRRNKINRFAVYHAGIHHGSPLREINALFTRPLRLPRENSSRVRFWDACILPYRMAGYGMAEESELATLNRRVTVLEEDARGEKDVLRHILRKVNDNENLLLETRGELRGEIAELAKKVNALHDELVLSRANVADTIAKTVAAVMREELSRRK
jgi:hypothetical protein